MKKEYKTRLISLFVIGVMAVSVLGGAFLYIEKAPAQASSGVMDKYIQDGIYVIREPVPEDEKQKYIGMGLTFIEARYDMLSRGMLSDIEAIPTNYVTPGGKIQAIVIELEADEPSLSAESLNGQEEMALDDPEMHSKLCTILYYPPVDCLSLGSPETGQPSEG